MEKKKKKILKVVLTVTTIVTIGAISYVYGPKVYRKYCKKGDAQQPEPPAQAQKPEPKQEPVPEQNIQKKTGWKPRYNNKPYND